MNGSSIVMINMGLSRLNLNQRYGSGGVVLCGVVVSFCLKLVETKLSISALNSTLACGGEASGLLLKNVLAGHFAGVRHSLLFPV